MDNREALKMRNIVWNKASNEHAELKVKDFILKGTVQGDGSGRK